MSEIATARATHQVLNQARPATGWNAFSDDRLLVVAGRTRTRRG